MADNRRECRERRKRDRRERRRRGERVMSTQPPSFPFPQGYHQFHHQPYQQQYNIQQAVQPVGPQQLQLQQFQYPQALWHVPQHWLYQQSLNQYLAYSQGILGPQTTTTLGWETHSEEVSTDSDSSVVRKKRKVTRRAHQSSSSEEEYDSDYCNSSNSKRPLKSFAVAVGEEALKVAPLGSGKVPINLINWSEVAKGFPQMSARDCKKCWQKNFKNYHFARVEFGVVLMCNEEKETQFISHQAAQESVPSVSSLTLHQAQPVANLQTNSNSNGNSKGGESESMSDKSRSEGVMSVSVNVELHMGKLIKRYGSNWSKIAEKLGNGATVNQIKALWEQKNNNGARLQQDSEATEVESSSK